FYRLRFVSECFLQISNAQAIQRLRSELSQSGDMIFRSLSAWDVPEPAEYTHIFEYEVFAVVQFDFDSDMRAAGIALSAFCYEQPAGHAQMGSHMSFAVQLEDQVFAAAFDVFE